MVGKHCLGKYCFMHKQRRKSDQEGLLPREDERRWNPQGYKCEMSGAEKFDGKPQTPLNVTVLSAKSPDCVKTLNNPLTAPYTCTYNSRFEDNERGKNPESCASRPSTRARAALIVRSNFFEISTSLTSPLSLFPQIV